MVAALAVDTRKGVASSEEVRNRQAEPLNDFEKLLDSATTKEELRALFTQARAGKASKDFLDRVTAKAEKLA
jgi:hypothetical protein